MPGARRSASWPRSTSLLGERFADVGARGGGAGRARARRRSTRSPPTARPSATSRSSARRSRSATPRVIAERTGLHRRSRTSGRATWRRAARARRSRRSSTTRCSPTRSEGRLVLNLGGIANVTWLPAGGGPGRRRSPSTSGPRTRCSTAPWSRRRRGASGWTATARARCRGRVDEALLARLLDDDFLRRPPPKSTGRERYGSAEAEALVAASRARGALASRTCSRRSSRSPPRRSARAWREHLAPGGGAPRARARRRRRRAQPGAAGGARRGAPAASPIETMDAAGVPADAAEAMAFSLLGRNALLGLPNHLPRCTGARGAARARRDRPSAARVRASTIEPVVRGFEAPVVAARAHLGPEVREHHAAAVEARGGAARAPRGSGGRGSRAGPGCTRR